MQFFCFLLLNIICALMEMKYYLLTYLLLYEIQPTDPARRLATQQVQYDQKGKSAVQRRRLQQRRLQQHSQYHFLDGAT